MNKALQSKGLAWLALGAVILILILTFAIRAVWWEFFDIFFAFMAVFSHLVGVYMRGKLPAIGKQMDSVAGFFGILFIIAFIVEFILLQVGIK